MTKPREDQRARNTSRATVKEFSFDKRRKFKNILAEIFDNLITKYMYEFFMIFAKSLV